MLSTWRHSGFNVFCGNRISPKNDTAMEHLACCIIRVSFSRERMQYLDQEGKVIYMARDGKKTKIFPALECQGDTGLKKVVFINGNPHLNVKLKGE